MPPPSSFAHFVAQHFIPSPANLLDVGCGNGRDSAFFARAGHNVLGIDISEEAINLCKRMHALPNAIFLVTSAERLQASSFTFDLIYSRFVLHAMTKVEEPHFLKAARDLLKTNGLLMIECRSVNDPLMRQGEVISPTERIHGHYRRFIDKDELQSSLKSLTFKLKYVVESQGLAVHCDDNPMIIRIIATKDAGPHSVLTG